MISGTFNLACVDDINPAIVDNQGVPIPGNPDGLVDVDECTVWSNIGSANNCNNVAQAVAEQKSKCGCERIYINLPITPTAVVLMDFTAIGRPENIELNW